MAGLSNRDFNGILPFYGLSIAEDLAVNVGVHNENAPLAVQTSKEIAVRAWEHERAFVLENALFQKVRTSEDAQEGPRSYIEKRPAVFKRTNLGSE